MAIDENKGCFWRKSAPQVLPFLSVALFVICAASATADQVYKIVGSDGKVTYSTTPPAENQKGTSLRMDVAAPDASKEGAKVDAGKKAAILKEAQVAGIAKSPFDIVRDFFRGNGDKTVVKSTEKTKMEISAAPPPSAAPSGAPAVTLAVSTPIFFYSANCADCAKARAFMDSQKIAYRAIDVGTEDGRRARNEVGGGKDVPYLLINGKRIKGFSPEAYEIALGAR
jgi:glutaredoxin